MYDLLLSGEGNAVVGTRSSMNPNSYRQRFSEQGVAEGEQRMSRAAKGYEKYGKKGMMALAKAGREGASEKKLDTIRDRHDNYKKDNKSVTEMNAGSVAGVVNPTPKNKAKVGSLFGGTYTQSKKAK
jgi:hypothetical protein